MEDFDYKSFQAKALEQLKSGKPLLGKDGAFAPLLENLLNAALEGEMDAHMDDEERLSGNRRNGYNRKQVQTSLGEVTVQTPRDRESRFEPEFIKKRERILAEGVADRIIGLYALGNSTREISDWMDAIHYKVMDDKNRPATRAIYNVLGVDRNGHKDLLGMYISKSEGANFWLSVLTDLQTRGVQDILIASTDNLTGFSDAINSVFPETIVQSCIVHQIRNSLKYVSSKYQKAFMKDLKLVYQAINRETAEDELDNLEVNWGEQYPLVIKSWRVNWH
jgi:transposase-like protein